MNNTQTTENVYDWMRSNRLYEESLFFYLLIIAFWVFVGLFTLGFELEGNNQVQNLAYNFYHFLALAGCMALTPVIYKLIFNRGSIQKRTDEINEKLATIADPVQRNAIQNHLANTGALAPRRLQTWALVFLGWCCLFEIFFISSWVKDLALVWQPEWVNAVIEWVRVNTTLPPLNEDRKVFLLDIKGTPVSEIETVIKNTYESDRIFLDSPFGKTCLFYHAWHALSFFPILIASIICLWQLIGWTGASNLESKKGIKGYLWLIVITFFMTLMFFGALLALFLAITYRAGSVTGLAGWIHNFWINIGYVFIIITIRLYVNWFVFFKNLIFTK